MKLSTFYLALLLSATTQAQFAVITDNDGWVNIRKDAAIANNISDKLLNGHIVYTWETTGNWTTIEYSKANKGLSGFVYRDRYKLVTNFTSIPQSSKTGSVVIFKKDSIEVTVTQKAFEKSKHTFKYFKDAPNQVQFIDNKEFWGTDGGMPTMEYKSIRVKIGQKVIELPAAALASLFEPSIGNTRVNFDREKNILYIQSSNSDGAGSYEVIWKIEKGVYKDRFIVYGF
jgi:hypothetical protein